MILINLEDTILTDSNGKFHFHAKSKYIGFRILPMDPPKPYIDLAIVKEGYEKKVISKYFKPIYFRRDPIQIYLDEIKIIKNAP